MKNIRNRFFLLLAIAALIPGLLLAGDDKGAIHLQSAEKAAKWLKSTALEQPEGIAWPWNPEKPGAIQYNLYAGTPGVILFFLEAYYATGKKHYLDIACKGADHLLTKIPEQSGKEVDYGLYTGVSGIGFVLEEVFRATGDKKYRKGVNQCLDLIGKYAKKVGSGIEWGEGWSDIISGTAGTGLFLLYIAERMKKPGPVKLAAAAGRRLIQLAKPEKGGLKWKSHPERKYSMPNFSHGTAGIAYFLATLYTHTRKKEFLDAALAGAKYLLAIAEQKDDTCLVFHSEPEGVNRFYLGWCHGPPGTARFFYRLYQITGDNAWMALMIKGARGILDSGIPTKQTPGFWNNVGRCCGSAGVAQFFLELHQITRNQTGNQKYLAFAKHMTDDLLKKATAMGEGLKWIHAEHRVKPGLLIAQTGLMQGAAGIGLWLLQLNSFEQGKPLKIVFPDSPF
jgi:lantibiotic modifying enzyme